jgi:lipopolysaccharide transport system ATP-binding protein
MSFEWAIEAHDLSKYYSLYENPGDRLKQLLWGRWLPSGKRYFQDFWALRDINFSIAPGEVVGIVGRNGAGKSTLLQMICGTLESSTGDLQVRGRVAALLELGAGFNSDFTGLENVYMNAAILGLTKVQIDDRLDDILAFADIGDFIRQPVKTYSSGMFMRLAFSVATSVEPDILVIDEALSVGDGAFARKSFERIMALKDAGKTILFCSHSMYQVEALCSRALWIESGKLRMIGVAADVTSAYQTSLNAGIGANTTNPAFVPNDRTSDSVEHLSSAPKGGGRINQIFGTAAGATGRELYVVSGVSNLEITMDFVIDPALPPPCVAYGFSDANNLTIASTLSSNDGVQLSVDALGNGKAVVVFPKLPLLKGCYSVTGFLVCENGIHLYEQVERCLLIHVTQKGPEQGLVTLPHRWLS